MSRIDFRRQDAFLYAAFDKAPTIVEVPELSFLEVAGTGNPDDPQSGYQQKVSALYQLALAIKYAYKDNPATQDYKLPPLEAIWAMADAGPFDMRRPEGWKWRLLLRQPDFVDAAAVAAAREAKKDVRGTPELLDDIQLTTFREGECVQMLHIGPYSAQAPTLRKMYAMAEREGYVLAGDHHEIYLNDPRKTPPKDLQTILRQPIKFVEE